jgi:hypothetical protein
MAAGQAHPVVRPGLRSHATPEHACKWTAAQTVSWTGRMVKVRTPLAHIPSVRNRTQHVLSPSGHGMHSSHSKYIPDYLHSLLEAPSSGGKDSGLQQPRDYSNLGVVLPHSNTILSALHYFLSNLGTHVLQRKFGLQCWFRKPAKCIQPFNVCGPKLYASKRTQLLTNAVAMPPKTSLPSPSTLPFCTRA